MPAHNLRMKSFTKHPNLVWYQANTVPGKVTPYRTARLSPQTGRTHNIKTHQYSTTIIDLLLVIYHFFYKLHVKGCGFRRRYVESVTGTGRLHAPTMQTYTTSEHFAAVHIYTHSNISSAWSVTTVTTRQTHKCVHKRDTSFCRTMLCKRSLCHHVVSIRLSVCLSRSWILSIRINISSKFFHFFFSYACHLP